MTFSEPWFREFDGWWYCHRRQNGKRQQVKLAKGRDSRDEAYDRWHALSLQKDEPVSIVESRHAVAAIDLYLDWCQKNRSQGTYGIYLHHLQSFSEHIGPEQLVSDLKPKHVTEWLEKHSWADSTKAGAAQTVRTAFRWLRREGHIASNPVAEAKGPSKKGRETILSDAEFAAVLKHSGADFRQLLEFLRNSGCRPQEAVIIEARHVDVANRRVVLPPSKAKGKKHPRVIYLNDRALEIIAEALRKHPEGRVLRTKTGQAWDRNKVRCRFRRLREKVGGSYCAYHLRHTFATDALQRLDPITVASLMGHADASTLARNYQHLAKLPAHMQEAANKAVKP